MSTTDEERAVVSYLKRPRCKIANIDPKELTNPWQAAIASFVAFSVGAVFPLLAMFPG